MAIIKDLTLYLPTHPTLIYGKRDINDIDTIVVHQTDSNDIGEFGAYDIARYHVNTNGWAGIGYHYFIIDDGSIFKTQEAYIVSAHAREWNNRSLGVVITGKHRYNSNKTNEEIIGEKKYKALVFTLAKIQTQFPKAKNIVGHGELQANRTDPNLDMEKLKLDVKKKDNSIYTKGSNRYIINQLVNIFSNKIKEIKEEFDYKNFVNKK